MMEKIGVVVILPADVYQVIISFLPMRSKYASRRVCRLWKHVIESRFSFPTFITSPSSCVPERVEPLPPGYDAIRSVVGAYCPADDMPLELLLLKIEGYKKCVLYRSSPDGLLEIVRVDDNWIQGVSQLNYHAVHVYLDSSSRILDLSTNTSSVLGLGDRVDPNAILDKTRSLRLEGNFDTDLYLVDPQQNKRRRLLLPQRGLLPFAMHECYQWHNRLIVSLPSFQGDEPVSVLTIFDLTEFYQLPDASSVPLAPMNSDAFRADSFHIHWGTGFATFADHAHDCFSAIDLSTGNTVRLTEMKIARKQSVNPQQFTIWRDFVVCLEGFGTKYELRISDLRNRHCPPRKYTVPMPVEIHLGRYMAFDGEVLSISTLGAAASAPLLQFKFVSTGKVKKDN